MADILTGDSPVEATAKLSQFKDYAVSHPQLVQEGYKSGMNLQNLGGQFSIQNPKSCCDSRDAV